MRKSFTLLILLLLSMTAFSAETVLTCTMSSIKSPNRIATAELSLLNIDDFASSVKNVKVGQDAYGFSFTAMKKNGKFNIDIIISEDINIQDQVGEISCVYNPKIKTSKFCVETIEIDGSPILNFFCSVNN